MRNAIREKVLSTTAEYYLSSADFNGIPVDTLMKLTGSGWDALKPLLKDLVHDQTLGILDSRELNPHILRTGFPPLARQIEVLSGSEPRHTCVYPRSKHLATIVDPSGYWGRPYTLQLALGEPQLAFRAFDLSVLESYRNDPRYIYSTDDISGRISIKDEFFQTGQMAEHDEVLLQSFGFAYDECLNRAVAVYLRYLSDLTPAHQQTWKAKELAGEYRLHPDYYRNTIVGEWGEGTPVLMALVRELHVINQMAKAMDRPPLFRRDYGRYGEGKPQALTLLVRPTLEEFNRFVLLLDKLLSDNLSKEFFQGDVPYETEVKRGDGRVVVQVRGTLQILDDWVRSCFELNDWEIWDDAIAALKRLRKLRQRPAHSIDENVFDQKYIRDQREIIEKVYSAVRTLRLILSLHPAIESADLDIPRSIEEGKVWMY